MGPYIQLLQYITATCSQILCIIEAIVIISTEAHCLNFYLVARLYHSHETLVSTVNDCENGKHE